MAQHDYVIDNSTGANVRADLNNALLAISSTNSGSSAPSTTYAFQLFANTTTSKLQIRNAGNSAFVDLIGLDGSILLPDGSVSSPSLAFSDDLNTGIFSAAADTFNVATGGVERMELGATTIFNEDGADVDFRIEGDTQPNLFYVDAGNGRIGINSDVPTSKLFVQGVSSEHVITARTADTNGNCIINILSEGTTGNSRILFSDSNGADAIISYSHNDGGLIFGSHGAVEDMRIDASGRVLIGHSSNVHNGGIEAHLQLIGTGTDDTSIILSRYSNDGSSPFLVFSKSRATNIGDNNVLQNGDRIGRIKFFGNDGTDDDTPAAEIDVEVDGTPGSNDMPGRIVFKTTADGASSTTERMRIDSSGTVNIGSTGYGGGGSNPILYLRSTSGRQMKIHNTASSTCGIQLSNNTTGEGEDAGFQLAVLGTGDGFINMPHSKAIIFNTANTERMRIDSSGRVGIGTTSPDRLLDVVKGGTNVARFQQTTNNQGSDHACITLRHAAATSSAQGVGMVFQNTGGSDVGSIRFGSSTSYNTSSDYRLKENVTAISDGITRLKTLKPSRFNFIADADTTVDGFLAHEVTAVPEAITGTKDEVDSNNNPVYQGIDQSKLVPLLVAAVQELIGKVEVLEAA